MQSQKSKKQIKKQKRPANYIRKSLYRSAQEKHPKAVKRPQAVPLDRNFLRQNKICNILGDSENFEPEDQEAPTCLLLKRESSFTLSGKNPTPTAASLQLSRQTSNQVSGSFLKAGLSGLDAEPSFLFQKFESKELGPRVEGDNLLESSISFENNEKLEAGDKNKDLGCKCKKSQCLKLYCDCFQTESFCQDFCKCEDCNNKFSNEKRSNAIRNLLTRKPAAFSEKSVQYQKKALSQDSLTSKSIDSSPIYKEGCNCKMSNCKKKYCECFAMGAKCSKKCKCQSCHNQLEKDSRQEELSENLFEEERESVPAQRMGREARNAGVQKEGRSLPYKGPIFQIIRNVKR